MLVEYFFRHVPDGTTNFNMASVWIALFVSVLLVHKFRYSKLLLNFVFGSMLCLQLMLIYWYYGEPSTFLHEGLPLFHCRIAAIMIPLMYYMKQKKLAVYFSWLGIIGTTLAFTIPDPSRYVWPHITNVTYIGSHILLMCASIMVIENVETGLRSIDIMSITLAMNTLVLAVDLLLKANYCYLMQLPFKLWFTPNGVIIFIIMTFLLICSISFLQKEYEIACKRNLAKKATIKDDTDYLQ